MKTAPRSMRVGRTTGSAATAYVPSGFQPASRRRAPTLPILMNAYIESHESRPDRALAQSTAPAEPSAAIAPTAGHDGSRPSRHHLRRLSHRLHRLSLAHHPLPPRPTLRRRLAGGSPTTKVCAGSHARSPASTARASASPPPATWWPAPPAKRGTSLRGALARPANPCRTTRGSRWCPARTAARSSRPSVERWGPSAAFATQFRRALPTPTSHSSCPTMSSSLASAATPRYARKHALALLPLLASL